jgi:hypothetical protein
MALSSEGHPLDGGAGAGPTAQLPRCPHQVRQQPARSDARLIAAGIPDDAFKRIEGFRLRRAWGWMIRTRFCSPPFTADGCSDPPRHARDPFIRASGRKLGTLNRAISRRSFQTFGPRDWATNRFIASDQETEMTICRHFERRSDGTRTRDLRRDRPAFTVERGICEGALETGPFVCKSVALPVLVQA